MDKEALEDSFRESEICYSKANNSFDGFECALESYIGFLQLLAIAISILVFVPAFLSISSTFRPLIKISLKEVTDKTESQKRKKEKIIVENVGNRIARRVMIKLPSLTYGPYIMGPGESRELDVYFSYKAVVKYRRFLYSIRTFTSYFGSEERVKDKVITENVRTYAGGLKLARFLKVGRNHEWQSDNIHVSLEKWTNETSHVKLYSVGRFMPVTLQYQTESRFEDILFIFSKMFGNNYAQKDDGIIQWSMSVDNFRNNSKRLRKYLKLDKRVSLDEINSKDIFYKIESHKDPSYKRREISSKVSVVNGKDPNFAISLSFYGVFDVNIMRVHRDRSGIIIYDTEVDLLLIKTTDHVPSGVSVILYNKNFTTSEQKFKYKFDEETYIEALAAVEEFKQEKNTNFQKFKNSYKSIASLLYWSIKSPI